jgi:hypothetical protein
VARRRRALTRGIPGYPATPDGQLGFASDLESILAAVPGGRGLGVFYWQPEWIPGIGWQPGAGTPNDNLTLFDFTGHALPGVSFADPLRACTSHALALAAACPGYADAQRASTPLTGARSTSTSAHGLGSR